MPVSDARPKFTVVVPCYKSEATLPRCLDSLATQVFDDYEVVCVNDGSPDGCEGIIRDYCARYPKIFRLVSRDNGGLYNARWSGVDVARSPYVGFLDSDDYVDPTFVVSLYNALACSGASIAVCGFRRTDQATGKVLSSEMGALKAPIGILRETGRLLEVNPAAWNKAYRIEVLRGMERVKAPITTLEDVMFNLLAYLEAGDGAVVFTGTTPIHYMVHADSMINTMTLAQLDEVKRSLLEVRSYYEAHQAPEVLLQLLDATAFLHLGVAMSSRLSANPEVDLRETLDGNTRYLDEHFPTWRTSPYIGLGYARKVGSPAIEKLAIARAFYTRGLMAPFLGAYRFVTTTLGIDIKW